MHDGIGKHGWKGLFCRHPDHREIERVFANPQLKRCYRWKDYLLWCDYRHGPTKAGQQSHVGLRHIADAVHYSNKSMA